MEFRIWSLEHGEQNKIGTWTTEQNWNKYNRMGLKHEKHIRFVTRIPEQVWNMENMTALNNRMRFEHGQQNKVCNKDTRTCLEHGEHDSFITRTRLEHGQQNKNGTWTT